LSVSLSRTERLDHVPADKLAALTEDKIVQ